MSVKLSKVFFNIRSYSTQIANDVSALAGINVIDFTRIVAGPYCTMMLGDLGAKVIKVEHPDGDESRKWGPPFVQNSDSSYFLACNRNKMSICVDIKSEQGKELIYDLVKKGDIFVENFVPGKLDAVGLGYNNLKKISPKIIYCSITGYGSHGPYKNKPGYDVVAAGTGGLLGITGERGGGPVKVGVAVTDICTGLNAFGAIMAALFLREKTGHGQKIECNLLSTQVACLVNIAASYLNGGVIPERWGTAHASIVPYQAFATKDGFVMIGAGSNNQFQKLCIYMGADHLSENVKYSSNQKRVENREELIRILSDIFSTKSTLEWLDIFKDAPFPNGPINAINEVFEDEHVKATKIVKEIEYAGGQTIKIVGPPVEYSYGSNRIRSAPPLLGQHTDEILCHFLEYDESKINFLKQNKIVR